MRLSVHIHRKEDGVCHPLRGITVVKCSGTYSLKDRTGSEGVLGFLNLKSAQDTVLACEKEKTTMCRPHCQQEIDTVLCRARISFSAFEIFDNIFTI